MNRVIEKHADLATKQRTVFDVEEGDDFGEVSQYLEEFFGSGCVNQSEKINDNWANSILVKGGNGRYDGPRRGTSGELLGLRIRYGGRDAVKAVSRPLLSSHRPV